MKGAANQRKAGLWGRGFYDWFRTVMNRETLPRTGPSQHKATPNMRQ